MPIQRTCVTCNSIFFVPPTRANATTCGRTCKSAMLRKRYQAEWVTKTCLHCGSEFKHPTWQKRRVYCSEPCKWTAESGCWAAREKSEGGSESKRSDGYVSVYLPRHPFAGGGEYVLKHRVVMEKWLRETDAAPQFMIEVDGVKYLNPKIEVHHRDKNRSNNEPSNLIACTARAHRMMHFNNPVPEGEAWPLDGLLVSYVRRYPETPPL